MSNQWVENFKIELADTNFINLRFTSIIINMFDSSESARFSNVSLNREISFDVYSFDVLLYGENVRGDHTISYVSAPSATIEGSTLLI